MAPNFDPKTVHSGAKKIPNDQKTVQTRSKTAQNTSKRSKNKKNGGGVAASAAVASQRRRPPPPRPPPRPRRQHLRRRRCRPSLVLHGGVASRKSTCLGCKLLTSLQHATSNSPSKAMHALHTRTHTVTCAQDLTMDLRARYSNSAVDGT